MKQTVLFLFACVLALGCGSSQPAPETPAPGVEGSNPAPTPPATAEVATPPPSPTTGGPGTEAALPMPCRKKASDVPGAGDSPRLVRCPQDCTNEAGTVWGTGIYTADSAVCPALVHAGVLPAAGGVASITFVRGLAAYVGSEQNGFKSNSYGKWSRSFYGQSLGSDGQPASPAPQLPAANTVRIDCSHHGNVAGSGTGTTLTVICPAGCAERSHAVWGSNPYTVDSQACAAAIHAGAIPASGGAAVLTLADGQPSYTGSAKNGIETRKYGKYGSSFTVAPGKE